MRALLDRYIGGGNRADGSVIYVHAAALGTEAGPAASKERIMDTVKRIERHSWPEAPTMAMRAG